MCSPVVIHPSVVVHRDMVVMNGDGSVQVKGRMADQIRYKVFGEVIYPAPVEAIVSKYPHVDGVAVSGPGTELVCPHRVHNPSYITQVTY